MSKWFFDILETVPGTLDDYYALSRYHYRTESIEPVTKIYKIRARDPQRDAFPDPLAVVVYRMPIPCLRARDRATDGFFHGPTTKSDRLKLVNKNIRYLARLIVDPRFRRLGIATKLLDESLLTQKIPIVETLIPLDWTNKMFQKVGFELHYIEAPEWYNRFTDFLKHLGFDDWDQLLPETLYKRLECLQLEGFDHIEKEIKALIKHFRHRKDMPHSLERCEFLLSKISFPQAYLIWYNPRVSLTP